MAPVRDMSPGQGTGCSSWFCTLCNVLVSEVSLIHVPSLSGHFNHFSHSKQLLFPTFHLPAWHCPDPGPMPSHPTLSSALWNLQGLDSRHFPRLSLWGSGCMGENLLIDTPLLPAGSRSSVHLGCTQRELPTLP